jgi:uncharacterized lipoprotein YajG
MSARLLACVAASCLIAACASTPAKHASSAAASILVITQCHEMLGVVVTSKDGMLHAYQDVDPATIEAAMKKLPDGSVGTLVVDCPTSKTTT